MAAGIVKIFGASFRESRVITVDWPWVVELLLAGVRIETGKHHYVKISWYALAIFFGVVEAKSEINDDRIAVFDFVV